MRRRPAQRRVPLPLQSLLFAVFLLSAAWALLMPPFQAPDEPPHFGYVQTLVEEFEIPGHERGQPFSSEQSLAANASNAPQVKANVLSKPQWSEAAYEEWRAAESRLEPGGRADGGGSESGGNTAAANPPLYYGYAGIPYVAGGAWDIFGRLHLMRLWSALLLLVSVSASWALMGELFGRDRLLQLTGAAFVGLQPMATFISASVTPDSLLIASFALSLWLGVRLLNRGLTIARGSALCGAVAVAVLTKGTGYALVPGALLVLTVGLWRARRARRSAGEALPGARAVAVPAAVLALPVAAWLAIASASGTRAINELGGRLGGGMGAPETPGLLSYLWQFYLPHLPFQTALVGYPRLPAWDYWLKGSWASFGYLEVNFPGVVYGLIAAATLVILAGGAAALVRARRSADLAAVAFVALVALCLLAGLHAIDFRNLGRPFMQGRYLLPLLPLLGVCAAGALRLLPARRRPAVAGLAVGGLFALQAGSFALVAGRYFA